MAELIHLSSIVTRDTVGFDGKQYELADVQQDLGPFEHARLLEKASEIDELRRIEKRTPAQQRSYTNALRSLTQLLLPGMEKPVLAKLKPAQMETIMVTWSAVSAEKGRGEGEARRSRTGSKSSRGSKRSTAATRKPGGTHRRGS